MTKNNISKFETKLSLQEGLYVSAKIRTHNLNIDEPKELDGTDKGPNPVELVLAALGGCQAIVLRFYGEKLGVKVKSVESTIQGDLDLGGFLGKPGIRPGFQNITAVTKLKAQGDPNQIKALLKIAEERCPVLDILKNGVPVKVQIEQG
ncbi:MAG: OsmC family protein [Chloroflexi bacterium]|nr:OsmC family protein [Chloroflexota bacterium]